MDYNLSRIYLAVLTELALAIFPFFHYSGILCWKKCFEVHLSTLFYPSFLITDTQCKHTWLTMRLTKFVWLGHPTNSNILNGHGKSSYFHRLFIQSDFGFNKALVFGIILLLCIFKLSKKFGFSSFSFVACWQHKKFIGL